MAAAQVVSVGYEGRSAEELVGALAAAGVDVLVDVRRNAVSRKPGLSKRALGERCEAHGIEYVHERTLGNPKENRDPYRAGDPAAVERYERLVADEGAEALARVAGLLGSGSTVALLCVEADAVGCHRSAVATHLADLVPGLVVHDL